MSDTGDLEDEDEVLAWITDEDTLEIPGRIEEVNARMLDRILDENDHVVVFFCKYSKYYTLFSLLKGRFHCIFFYELFQTRRVTRKARKF